jgi:putative membrane protein
MIKDHTATSAELKSLGSRGKVQVNKAHGAKLDKLSSLSGADFSKAYEDRQVSAHKDAVFALRALCQAARSGKRH